MRWHYQLFLDGAEQLYQRLTVKAGGTNPAFVLGCLGHRGLRAYGGSHKSVQDDPVMGIRPVLIADPAQIAPRIKGETELLSIAIHDEERWFKSQVTSDGFSWSRAEVR